MTWGPPQPPEPSVSAGRVVTIDTPVIATTPSPHLVSRPCIRNDKLGKLIGSSAPVNDYEGATSWEDFIGAQRAPLPDLSDNVGNLDHPASSLLRHLRAHGAPIPTTTTDWSDAMRDRAVLRGSHQSAMEDYEFVRTEFVDFLNKRFWTILPYRLLPEASEPPAPKPLGRGSPVRPAAPPDRRPVLLLRESGGIHAHCT
jgi:hypothetical protein